MNQDTSDLMGMSKGHKLFHPFSAESGRYIVTGQPSKSFAGAIEVVWEKTGLYGFVNSVYLEQSNRVQ